MNTAKLVQKELRKLGLEEFCAKYRVLCKDHPTLHYSILYYNSAAGAVPFDPIVGACRSMVIDRNTLTIIAKTFDRFFNYGEYLDKKKPLLKVSLWNRLKQFFNPDARAFDEDFFKEAEVQEKLDGSLITVYYHDNCWFVNTSKTFGNALTHKRDTDYRELFDSIAGKNWGKTLNKKYIYTFELTSPINQVVKLYEEAALTLLAVFKKKNFKEVRKNVFIEWAEQVKTFPKLKTQQDVQDYIAYIEERHPTEEGFVLRHPSGLRIKMKSSKYVQLSRSCMASSRIWSPEFHFQVAIEGETDEMAAYYPLVADKFIDARKAFETFVNDTYSNLGEFIDIAEANALQNKSNSRKEFALLVAQHCNSIKGLYFKLLDRMNAGHKLTIGLVYEVAAENIPLLAANLTKES